MIEKPQFKKFLAFGFFILVVGLVFSAPLNAAVEVQNGTTTSVEIKSPCAALEGGIHSRQAAVLRGPVAAFEAALAFNGDDSRLLRRQLHGVTLVPQYSTAKDVLVKANNFSARALVVSITNGQGKVIGRYYHINSERGSSSAIVILKNNSAMIYITNGTAVKTLKVIKDGEHIKVLGLFGWLSCARCIALGTFVCGSAMAFAGSMGCWTGCPMFSVLGPLAVGLCFIICETAVILGSAYSCYDMSKTACHALGKC
ncbi:hypothetical protein [Thermococcus sp.]|uniref:hypothetical protein n=2 Tax=Thermococcus sp. TaxID=35749 RepID=UPI0026169902|nr:hypothetical protein [Thermococcus sp.]